MSPHDSHYCYHIKALIEITKSKALDELSLCLDILTLEVCKKVSSLTNHLKKTTV